MSDKILLSFNKTSGLKLGHDSAYEYLANRLAYFPLDWSKLKEITIVGANLSGLSYEMSVKFEQDGLVEYTRIVYINDFEMRIE